MLIEPLTPAAARDLARAILETGRVQMMEHHELRMRRRGFTVAQCIETIRTSDVEKVHFVGTWRYRFRSETLAVAILFQDEQRLWIVTAYDPRRKRQRD